MIDFGSFLNPFLEDARMFVPVAIGIALALFLFGYFYNRALDNMSERRGRTAFFVVGGTLFTLGMIAILSWKAAVLALCAFAIDGAWMIMGDVTRAISRLEKENRNPRKQRKPLPYAAAALVDDSIMALSVSQRIVKEMLKDGLDGKKVGLIGLQIAEAIQKLIEARKVEGE